MKVLVAGGTGRVGHAVMTVLNTSGHHAVAGSPSAGVNTVSGVGLAAAANGADAVLDVTAPGTYAEGPATTFFRVSTRNLLIAEMQTGVGHHVVLSASDAGHHGRGFRRAKIAQESAVRAGSVPFTIVRASHGVGLLDLAVALARIVVGPPHNDVVELDFAHTALDREMP